MALARRQTDGHGAIGVELQGASGRLGQGAAAFVDQPAAFQRDGMQPAAAVVRHQQVDATGALHGRRVASGHQRPSSKPPFKLANRPVGPVKASEWQRSEETVPALQDGQVLESSDPQFVVGDPISGLLGLLGLLGVQGIAVSDGQGLTKVDPQLAPLPTYLSTLGMPGLTACFGLLDVGQPEAGDTVVVSGAASAVGSVVGQIAKIKGARVVGIAGGADKCRYLVEELGFDAVIDHKTENVAEALKAHCPDGVNVYVRQRWRRHSGRRTHPPGTRCAHRGLRRDLAVQQHQADQGAGQLPVLAGQPRIDDRHRGLRLLRPGQGSGDGHGRLDGQGPAQDTRRHRRRPGRVSGRLRHAVQRRQQRQAGAQGRAKRRSSAQIHPMHSPGSTRAWLPNHKQFKMKAAIVKAYGAPGEVTDITQPALLEWSYGVLKKAGRLVSIILTAHTSGAGEKPGVVSEAFFMSPSGEQLAQIGALAEQGLIKPLNDKVFTLDQTQEAVTTARRGAPRAIWW